MFNFSIVLLAVQGNHKIEIDFSGCHEQVIVRVY